MSKAEKQAQARAEKRAVLNELDKGPRTADQLVGSTDVSLQRVRAILMRLVGQSTVVVKDTPEGKTYELWRHVAARLQAHRHKERADVTSHRYQRGQVVA